MNFQHYNSFISVSTTTFMWMVFLPTYFTTFYAYHQAALLAFCLLLNASITLLCLYIPKIYAIYFIDEDKLTFSFNDQMKSVSSSFSTGVSDMETEIKPPLSPGNGNKTAPQS